MDTHVTNLFFPSGQIWAYEAVPELDEHFGQRLHVHATLRPTEVERDLPYIASLVPFPDRPVPFLDNFARRVVGPQFHEVAPASEGCDGSATSDDHDDDSEDGSTADENGESSRDTSIEISVSDTEDDEDASGWQSGALPTLMGAPSISGRQGTCGGPTVTREDVEGMLLDQRILIEMRLRTMKLEII
ncbi:Hypothetical predicted protein [Olea europaea subsp. europaea]|uniref:Uncharacterized protein n=1 Tax=Olea europaea subsp. europaea TaxID=158383 RepID=A0A8S0V6Y6_OLEEU|nr:Hypothetical predicted protein [Olea europaea subsp. europaea]